MAELQASSFNRVSVTLSDGTNFVDTRGSTTGTSKGSITTSFNAAVQIIKDAGRGAGTFALARLYVKFNTSAISVLPSTANIKFTIVGFI